MDTISVSNGLPILCFLIVLSAFFSASETSLFSVNKIRLESLADNGNRKAKKALKLLSSPDDLLSTILVMNNLVNITISSLTTVIFLNLFGNLGVSLATGITTFMVLIFGEITPKSLAIQNSEKCSLLVVDIISFFVMVLKPIVIVFNVVSNTLKKVSKKDNTDDALTEEEIKKIVHVSEENGVLDLTEKELIYNVFDFSGLTIKDIMVQKTNIVALDSESDFEETINVIKKEKYSRIPVYQENIDNIIGMLNVKELLFNDVDKEDFNIKNYVNDIHHTYGFKKVDDLFKEMKKSKNHMAVVLDEYGATKGIVTMEDMIEEIVGDIDDEYDTIEDNEIIKISDISYIVSGVAKIRDIVDVIGIDIDYVDEDYDSIGGHFIKHFDGFPKIDDTLIVDNILFSIKDIENKSIKKIEVTILESICEADNTLS